MASFAQGLSDFGRGTSHVMARSSLYKWVALPFLLSLVILAAVAWAVWTLAEPGTAAIANMLPGIVASIVGGALKIVLLMLLGLAGYFVFVAVAALIAAPFCEMLSEAMEEELAGASDSKGSLVGFLRDLVVGIWHALRRVAVYLISVLVLFAIGAFVPVLGPIVATLVGIVITIRFAAFDAMDAVMARKSWSYEQKKAFVQAHSGRTFGLGAGITFFMLIPVIGALALPFGAAGATLLYVDIGSPAEPLS